MNESNADVVPMGLVWAVALSLAGLVVSCDRAGGGEESETSRATDQSWEGDTESGNYRVSAVPEPNPILFQRLFELKVEVTDAETGDPATDVRLDQVRARMPAHEHGMKTSPKIDEKDAGRFRVSGMKFHMRGEGEDGRWVVELILQGDSGLDRAEFEVQCCTQ